MTSEQLIYILICAVFSIGIGFFLSNILNRSKANSSVSNYNAMILKAQIDAADQVVGRLAVQVANLLRGKHRPEFTHHHDAGEFVIILNASKLRFTGRKINTKVYRWYTHYPGGLKTASAKDWMENHPDRIIREAVKRMMPKTPLARQQITKLKIYAGTDHPHHAQKPVEFKV